MHQASPSFLLKAHTYLLLLPILLIATAAPVCAQPAQLTIDVNHIVSPVSPTLYGLMTEEINHAYDGGLYAELVQNRTFHETWEGEPPWDLIRRGNAVATRALDKTTGPSEALPYSMKLTATNASKSNEAGLTNPGYWGYSLKPNTTYSGSLYARVGVSDNDDADPGPLSIRLVNNTTGAIQAHADIQLKPGAWQRYEYKLVTSAIAPSVANHLEVTISRPGTVWLQQVSLMPPTFHDRPNGNRADLMQRMAAMHPAFLRLPGGNYLEGNTIAERFDWTKTIGPTIDRPGHPSPWMYWSDDGLGLLEFLEWCEDLKVEPVLAVYAGYSLAGEHVDHKDLKPYVQSALDEIEYVAGDITTKWGAVRARDGHPAPFPLHYVEIGNEDWLDKSSTYPERYPPFAQAIRKHYPQLKLIATDGNDPHPTQQDADLSDEHYYKTPADMMDLVHHYDTAPRTGPKIFVGEWATRSGSPTPNFGDALGDAAWMTGLERNSDLILMAAYAPLLVNVSPGAMQWPTDLIGYDAATTYASPSYWAQCLFAAHLGDGTVKSSLTGENKRFFYSSTVSSKDKILHLKLVNASSTAQSLFLTLQGINRPRTAHLNTLHASTYDATNTLHNPDTIHPVSSTATIPGSHWNHTLPPFTIEVIDIPF